MKLYASHTSPYSRLALISAYRTGRNDVRLQFVQPWDNPPELLEINPFSQIPALLTDDGNVITDSLIITHFFDETTQCGGNNCAVTSFAITTINQAVKAFSLEKFQPAGSVAHPHIARAKAALTRALPHAPTLSASSESWAQIALGNALNYVRMRLPEIYEKSVSTDNKAAVAEFIKRDFMVKTTAEALEKNPATVGNL